MKTEITFIVEDAIEGGYTAHALDEAIVTEADTMDELHEMVRDAVDVHFEPDEKPKIIHLHFVRDEVIAA
ncbi:MAG: 2-oxoisovalerate dehydrogenase [bacterium]